MEQWWGIKAFLKQWVESETDSFTRTRQIQLLQEALDQVEVRTALATSTDDNDLSTETLVKKFNALIGKDFLHKYDHTASIEKLDYALAFEVIESNAPTWASLLTQLMSHQRHHWSSYGPSKNWQPNKQQVYLLVFAVTKHGFVSGYRRIDSNCSSPSLLNGISWIVMRPVNTE
jgi:hypothetical protein